MNFELRKRPEVYFGKGLEYSIHLIIKKMEYNTIIILTDKGIRFNTNIIERIERMLISLQHSFCVYDGIISNPTTDCVVEGVRSCINIQNPIFILVGGGSVLDAGKCIIFCLCNFHDPIKASKNISVFSNRLYLSKSLKLKSISSIQNRPISRAFPTIAIPTTSGTGSEGNHHAVIHDHNEILFISNYGFMPMYVILEPEISLSAPRNVILSCGFDALTHALESLISNRSNLFTEMLAKVALKTIYTCLISFNNDSLDNHMASQIMFAAHIAYFIFFEWLRVSSRNGKFNINSLRI